jgi:MOSC domain-containing protein YiiM
MAYQTAEQLEAGMGRVLDAPKDQGPVRLVVRRPGRGEREILSEGQLDTEQGLIGDDWVNRPGMHRETPSPHAQVTVMNARAAELVSGDPEPATWAQCGDQLYIDLDISEENLPAGARNAVGEAILELQAEPHTGCVQFRSWWGADALRHISTKEGLAQRMRGANTRVVQSGVVRPGDIARKVTD